MALPAAVGRLSGLGGPMLPGPPQHPTSTRLLSSRRPLALPATAASAGAAANTTQQHLGGAVDWSVEVTRNTLTIPQVLQHLEQQERMEAFAASRRAAAGHACAAPSTLREQNHISWVEHSTSTTASLMEGIQSDADSSSSEDEMLAGLAALPTHALTEAQQAAVVLSAWERAAPTKPANFDADAQLTLPGLADVAVVSRGGWQRRTWKGCNQDAFLALPLAAGSAACQDCDSLAACCSPAVAIGVFDGHGRAGQAASAHLRNALASGLLMHNQLALMARPACQLPSGSPGTASSGAQTPPPQHKQQQQQQKAGAVSDIGEDAASEVAALLERCFAAAASTMPSTGADFSLSGSTAVMCLIQPGSVTAAWSGDSRAVLGLHKGKRYIACALTRDHKPSSPLERARIEQTGGWVMQTMVDDEGRPAGPHRVYLHDSTIPGLAVSRCFGDFVAATAGVTSTPDVTTLVLPTGPSPQRRGGRGLEGQTRARGGAQQQQQPAGGVQQRGASKGRGSNAGQPKGAQQQQQKQGQQGAQLQPQKQGQLQRRGGQGQGRTRGTPPGTSSAHHASSAHHILIVASDGLWDFVSNAQAVRIASKCATAKQAAEALTLEAQAQWAVKFGGQHCDDITVACAFLPAH